jgi:hypothetical protein
MVGNRYVYIHDEFSHVERNSTFYEIRRFIFEKTCEIINFVLGRQPQVDEETYDRSIVERFPPPTPESRKFYRDHQQAIEREARRVRKAEARSTKEQIKRMNEELRRAIKAQAANPEPPMSFLIWSQRMDALAKERQAAQTT